MAVGSYTNDAKPRDENKLKLEANNLKVYYKFEVQGTDKSTSSQWSAAHTACRNLGGTWRLPTQRELQLIWMLHEGLKKLDDFRPFGDFNYWSASETSSNTSNAWFVNFTFSYGITRNLSKTNSFRVRCIREL